MAPRKGPGDSGDAGGEFNARLIAALNHDVRRTILRLLADADRPLSPVAISKRTGIPLSTVSYHVKVLLGGGVVELEDARQVRGAIERFYRSLIEDNRVAKALLRATRRSDEKKSAD